jgi:hypothetical protein
MLEAEIGPMYRQLRVNKGFTLAHAAKGVTSPQFLSQFERGQSRIGFGRLVGILENIHVSMEELMASRRVTGTNWLDWWAFTLDYAQRNSDGSVLEDVACPQRLKTVVEAINRVALLPPAARRRELTRVEKIALANIVTRSERYGVFINIIISYSAVALPASVRRHAITTISRQAWWDEVRYLRAGTSFSAMWGLAEAEIYLRNYLKAELLMRELAERLAPSDLYERLGLAMLEAEYTYARDMPQKAMEIRERVLSTLRILDDQGELKRYATHFDVVWQELEARGT